MPLPENWEQLISGWMEGPHFPLSASAKEICSKPLSQLAAEREDESEAHSQARIRLSCGISCPVREPLGSEGMCLHKDHTHKALPSLWLSRSFYFVRWETIGGWWSKRVHSGAAGHAVQSQAVFPAHPLYPPSLPLSSFHLHIPLCCYNLLAGRPNNHWGRLSLVVAALNSVFMKSVHEGSLMPCNWEIGKACFPLDCGWLVSELIYLSVVSSTLIGNIVTWFTVQRAQRGMLILSLPWAYQVLPFRAATVTVSARDAYYYLSHFYMKGKYTIPLCY